MYRILVVDDERAIVEGLAEMISVTSLPFKEIRIAYSAEEVLEYINKELFDIILMDIRMPQMDGLELYERLISMKISCKVIYLSGYSDFEYARKALKLGASDYLLKPAEDEEVISCLEKAIVQIENEREKMIAVDKTKKMLNESITSLQGEYFRNMLSQKAEINSDLLDKKFQELLIPFNSREKITCISIRIDEASEELSFDEESLIRFSIQNIVGEMLDGLCNIVSFSLDNRMMALLIQIKENTGSDFVFKVLRDRLVEAQDVICRVFKVVISFSLMGENVDWCIWPEEFRKILADMRLRFGRGLILVPTGEGKHNGNIEFPDLIKDSIEAINARDITAFEKSLDQITEKTEKSQKGPANKLVSAFMTICSHLMNAALKYNAGSVLGPEDTEKLSNFYMHRNLNELKKYLVGILSELIKALNAYQRNPTEALVDQVKSYIATHPDEYLSLDILSKKTYVNPSYLSRVFRQITQEQLSTYIARIKMEYARKLLMENELRIQDIVQKTGFENASYFAKVFRRIYGMSPQEYRIYHDLE